MLRQPPNPTFSGKRMLYIECPFVSHQAHILFFEAMGFEVRGYQFDCRQPEDLLNVKDDYNLADFDIVLICVMSKNTLLSSALLKRFRQNIHQAMAGQSFHIPIIGMNLNLGGQQLATQAKIFDGLFIDETMNTEQVVKVLERVL